MAVALVNNRFLPRAQPVSSGPAPSGDALLAVANIAALGALDDTSVDDGGVVSVKSVLDLWMLDKSSPLAIDGITVIATNSGTGKWVRLKIPNLTWQLQALWYVNESTGNDENSGSSSLSALKTWAEYQRRVGEGPLTVSHVVTFVGTITQDINVNTAMIDDTVEITLQGVRSSPLYSGSVTAKQAENPAANVDLQITDGALPVGWTASGLVDKMYVLTSGPNAGACGWVVKDVGAKAARVTAAYNEGAGTYVEPAVGETFDVVDLGLVEGKLNGVEGGNVRIVVRDLRFISSGSVVKTEGGNWQFFYCDVDGQDINLSGSSQQSSSTSATAVYASRMLASQGMQIERATVTLYATMLASGLVMRSHGTLVLTGASTVFQYKGVGLGSIQANGGSRITVDVPLAVFDLVNASDRALLVTLNGIAALRDFVYGYGNTFNYAFEVGSGSSIIYQSGFAPVVTAAAVTDALIGQLNRNYVQLPVSNNGRNCAFCLE